MLGAALSFTCPTGMSICYSVQSPATDAAFRDLQGQINKFAQVAHFARIAIDGKIGEGTASAARTALSYASTAVDFNHPLKETLILLKPFATSRHALAGAANAVADALFKAAVLLGLSAPTPGTVPQTPSPPIPTIPPVFPVAMLPGGANWWAKRSVSEKATMGVGGVAALGLLVIVLLPKLRQLKRRRASA